MRAGARRLPLFALRRRCSVAGGPSAAHARSRSAARSIDGPDVRRPGRRRDGRGRHRRARLPQARRRSRTRIRGAAPAARWRAPQRVDVGQDFDSSWPAIGAGDGGRLVVTWVQEFGAGSDRLFSASLDPGATRFQAPVAVDLNVGEANGTYPSLAMNRGGRPTSSTGSRPRPAPNQTSARLRRHRHARRALQRLLWSLLGVARRPQPVRLRCARRPRELAAGRHRRDRQRARRVPGARRRVRRPRLGAARLRHDVRHPAAGQPAAVRRRAAARRRRAFALDVSGFGAGRGRLPPAARPSARRSSDHACS